MFDPDQLIDAEERTPRYYWALLAWVIAVCLVVGVTAHLMSEVCP